MSDTLEQEIRHLRALYWSDRDPEGRAFAPLADACLRAGRPVEARELLEDGTSRLPDFLPGHLVSARLHEAMGNPEDAEAAYLVAHDLDPENSEVLLGLGRILAGRGVEEGVEMVERARALDPTVGRGVRPVAPSTGAEVSVRGQAPPDVGHDDVEVDLDDVPSVADFAPSGVEDFASPWDLEEDPGTLVDSGSGDVAVPEVEAERDDVPSPEEEEEDAVISVADLAPDELPSSPPPLGPQAAAHSMESEGAEPEPAAAKEGTADVGPEPDDDDGVVVTTRTLAELFVRQGLTERAIEVYERLLARNPEDDGIRARLTELGAEAPDPLRRPERSSVSDSTPALERLDLPDRHLEPDAPSSDRSAETTHPDDTDPHVPQAPDPHPEDPTPFGWAETEEEPSEMSGPATSIASYLGRLLAFTPGQDGVAPDVSADTAAVRSRDDAGEPDASPEEESDDALFDTWEDRS